MASITCSFAALAVANIFYFWRGYNWNRLQKERVLRERVAYMLWVMANGVE